MLRKEPPLGQHTSIPYIFTLSTLAWLLYTSYTLFNALSAWCLCKFLKGLVGIKQYFHMNVPCILYVSVSVKGWDTARKPIGPTTPWAVEHMCLIEKRPYLNREYLAPQIRSMNNRFHSEAELPWSYDYPLANHIATYKSSAHRDVPLFSRHYLFSGIFGKFSRPGV